MPNRAERRKQQKISVGESRRSTTRPVAVPDPACSTSTRFRRSPAVFRRAVDDSGVWKPSARTEVDEEVESVFEANPNYQDPKAFKAPHSVRQCSVSAAGR